MSPVSMIVTNFDYEELMINELSLLYDIFSLLFEYLLWLLFVDLQEFLLRFGHWSLASFWPLPFL